MDDSLLNDVGECLRNLKSRSSSLGGPADIRELFLNCEEFPEIEEDSDSSYSIGYIRGVADGLEMRTLDLIHLVEARTDG